MYKKLALTFVFIVSIVSSILIIDIGAHFFVNEQYVPYQWIYRESSFWLLDEELIFISQRVSDLFKAHAEHPLTPDIISIGDSFTQGDPLKPPLDYPSQLEKRLASTSAYTVLNLGVGGYGPDQQLRLLKRALAHGMKPKVVIWQFYPNDIYENLAQSIYTIDSQKTLKPLDPRQNWIFKTQSLYKSLPLPDHVKERSTIINYLLNFSKRFEYSSLPQEIKSYEDQVKWSLEKIALDISDVESLSKEHRFEVYYVLISPQYMYLNPDERTSDLSWLPDYDEILYKLLSKKENFIYFNFSELSKTENLNIEINSKDNKNIYFDDGSRDPMPYGNRHLNEVGYDLLSQVLFFQLMK